MNSYARIACAALGLLLAVASALLSPSLAESTLLGHSAGQLQWGPALFRLLLAVQGFALLGTAVQPSWLGTWAYRPLDDSEPPVTPPAHYAVLVTLVFFAALTRLIRIEAPLWLDEVFTLVDYGRPPLGVVMTDFSSQNQHMLYTLLMQGSMALFGESPFALRLPAVIFGALTPVPLYFLGRRLIGSLPALGAAALLTFSYHHVWFSQDARGYTGLLFFVLLSTHFWLRSQRRGGVGTWCAYVLVTAAGLWIHVTMVFVLAGQGLVWLAEHFYGDRGHDPRAAAPLAWAWAAGLTLQLYALSLPSFFSGAMAEFDQPSAWRSPWWALAEAFRGLVRAVPEGYAAVAAVAAAAGLAVALLGWLSLLREHPRAAWLMLWPPVLGAAAMLAQGHNLWPRFFFFCFGFAVLIAILGVYEVVAWVALATGYVERARNWAPVVIVLIVGASALTVPRNYLRPKQDFPGAKAFIEAEAQPGEMKTSVGLAATVFSSYFAPYWANARDYGEFSAARTQGSRTWVLYCMPIHLRAWSPKIWAAIQADFETVAVFRGTLSGGEVYVAREKTARQIPHSAHPR